MKVDCPGGEVGENPPANAGGEVQSLVREDSAYLGAAKARHLNC